MKNIVSLLLSVIIVLSVFAAVPITANAQETTEYRSGDYEYIVLADGTAEITDYSGSETELTIPSALDGYKVTSIGNSAFRYCMSLTSITIPEGVTSIGECAFYNCTSLISITIPEGVTSIAYNAFFYCESLTSITIPSSVTSIDIYAFYICPSLTSIKVDSNNKYYDSRNNCNAIIETSTNTLVLGCKNTVIPSGVTSIGENAFAYCSSLTSITIPESVTSIGDYAFEYCTSLTSITIPDGVTSISGGMFSDCENLISITVPESVTSIKRFAFFNCSSLASISIFSKDCSFGSNSIEKNTKIYCFEGSTAEQYAKTQGIAYEIFCINGHTKVIDKGYDATYGKDGLTDGSHCSVCGKVLIYPEIIPALQYEIGDADGDGEITVLDATTIQRIVAQLISIDDSMRVCTDADKDGEITIMDATTIQRFIAQLIPEF